MEVRADGTVLRPERVLQHRVVPATRGRAATYEYLIKWEGYSAARNSWLPVANLVLSRWLLEDHWRANDTPPPPGALPPVVD